MAATRVYVTKDLSLMVYHGGGFVEICTPSCPEGANLDAIDIPLLIAALKRAAEEMGVETQAAKYRALCVEILDDLEGEEMDLNDRWENWRRVLRANLAEQ